MNSTASGARLLSDSEKLLLEQSSDNAASDTSQENSPPAGTSPVVTIQAEAIATIITVMREAVTPLVLDSIDDDGNASKRVDFAIDFQARLNAAVLLLGASIQGQVQP